MYVAAFGSLLLGLAVAQNVAWVNPPIAGIAAKYADNRVWQLGSTQTLEWQASFPTAAITLSQEDLNKSRALVNIGKVVSDLQATSFVWKVDTLGLDFDFSNVFYLGVSASDGSTGYSQYVTSHYVNFTKDAVPSASSSRGSPPAATSSSNTSSSPASSSSRASTSDGLSTGAVAGIAVGCTVVGLALIAGLGLLVFRRRKRARQGGQVAEGMPALPRDEKVAPVMDETRSELAYQPAPQELETPQPTYEMDGSLSGPATTTHRP